MTKSPMDHRRRKLHYMLHSADNTTTQIHVNKRSTHETRVEKLTSGDKPFPLNNGGCPGTSSCLFTKLEKGKLISGGEGSDESKNNLSSGRLSSLP